MSPSNEGFGSLRHLAARFFDSLRPGGPPPGDETWATAQLLPGEQALWVRMSGPDRRHAVGVAREAIADLAPDGTSPVGRPVLAAALLHDIGKVEAGLGTWGRAAVTIVAMAAGRNQVVAWSPPDAGVGGLRASAGRYVTHDRLGAALLLDAGSDPLTVAWAAEHHLPEASWTVERRIADALKAADGD